MFAGGKNPLVHQQLLHLRSPTIVGLLELRYCRRDHKVKGGLERALLKADLIRKVRYVLPRSLSTRYLRRHLSIECEIQFTAKGFLVLLSCGPETITKV